MFPRVKKNNPDIKTTPIPLSEKMFLTIYKKPQLKNHPQKIGGGFTFTLWVDGGKSWVLSYQLFGYPLEFI